jgi:hypothetical protein
LAYEVKMYFGVRPKGPRQKPVMPRSQFLQNPQLMLNGRQTMSPIFIRSTADLNDPSQVFVPQHFILFEIGAAFIHMQVETADVRTGDLHQCVRRPLKARVWNCLHLDLSWSLVHDSFHNPAKTSFSKNFS